jgi:hypothetical protein
MGDSLCGDKKNPLPCSDDWAGAWDFLGRRSTSRTVDGGFCLKSTGPSSFLSFTLFQGVWLGCLEPLAEPVSRPEAREEPGAASNSERLQSEGKAKLHVGRADC